jgi:hypothetical protein
MDLNFVIPELIKYKKLNLEYNPLNIRIFSFKNTIVC